LEACQRGLHPAPQVSAEMPSPLEERRDSKIPPQLPSHKFVQACLLTGNEIVQMRVGTALCLFSLPEE
jgi:hypothetical protein